MTLTTIVLAAVAMPLLALWALAIPSTARSCFDLLAQAFGDEPEPAPLLLATTDAGGTTQRR